MSINHEECIETLEWTVERLQKLEKVEDAIREYHYALDHRKHGGVAQDVAFNRICDVLNMHWNYKYTPKKKPETLPSADHTWELP